MCQFVSFKGLATIICVVVNILQVQGQLTFNWWYRPSGKEYEEPAMNKVKYISVGKVFSQ